MHLVLPPGSRQLYLRAGCSWDKLKISCTKGTLEVATAGTLEASKDLLLIKGYLSKGVLVGACQDLQQVEY